MKFATQAFEWLVRDLRIDCKHSAWTRTQSLRDRLSRLAEEVEEAKAAVDAGRDPAELCNELGDVLWDWITVVIEAEALKLFLMEDVIRGAIQKLHRRKPFLFNGTPMMSLDEEVQLVAKLKAQEKR